jgi:hypothetical protein
MQQRQFKNRLPLESPRLKPYTTKVGRDSLQRPSLIRESILVC